MAVQLERLSFTVDKYEKMIEANILGEDDHVELIRGEIVMMAPIGLRHAACVARLVSIFARLGGATIVWPQNTIRVTDDSEPEPDVALLKPQPDFYTGARPEAEDVFLLVEVAESSVAKDRAVKVPLYAEAGVQEFWIVNLPDNAIEVYANPASGTYTDVRIARKGETLQVLGITVSVDEVLG